MFSDMANLGTNSSNDAGIFLAVFFFSRSGTNSLRFAWNICCLESEALYGLVIFKEDINEGDGKEARFTQGLSLAHWSC